jgi:hypothetical protein
MARTISTPVTDLPDLDSMSLPPMPPKILAAYKRMWLEPDLFDDMDPGETGIWVVFSGANIVA